MKKLNRNEWIAVALGLAFVAYLLYGSSFFGMLGGTDISNEIKQETRVTTLPSSGVETEDLQVGSGVTASAGDKISVHYVGALPSGKIFDSSLDRGQPFSFTLGAGEVIRGWDEGLEGMQVGGVRRVVIAPDYGYGAQAIGSIPADSHLIFEVQLLDVDKQ